MKTELKLRCQPMSGKKHVLAQRLHSEINKKLPRHSTLKEAKKKAKPQKKKRIVKVLKLFPDTAIWRQLYPDSAAIQEPANPTFHIARAPNISEKDAGHVPKKYNFSEHFDIHSFIGMKKEFLFDCRSKLRKDSSSGKPPTKYTLPGDKDCVNPELKCKNKLSADSKPWVITDAFIPCEHKKKSADNYFSFAQMTEWTNIKATSAGAKATMWYVDDWNSFTVTELRQHLAPTFYKGLLLLRVLKTNLNPNSEIG